jgi:hypothetical protein
LIFFDFALKDNLMHPKQTRLDELKAATGVTEFDAVADEQFAQVIKKAAEGGLSLEQLQLLIQVMPQFLQLQEKMIGKLVEGLKKLAEGAQSSQKEALQAVGHSLDDLHQTLHVLAQNAETDEARVELAKLALEMGKQDLELARIIKEMNEANNSFWWRLASTIGTTVTAISAVAIFLVSKIGELPVDSEAARTKKRKGPSKGVATRKAKRKGRS